MSSPQPWYVEKRAEALAIVYLTRRSDLRVVRGPAEGEGLDLLVTVLKDGAFSSRQFGVVLKARRDGAAPPRLEPRWIQSEHALYADAPFPICMLFFTVSDDAGWFRWVVEPAVEDGAASLGFSHSTTFEPLTDELLDRLVDEVNAWYDARSLK